MRKQHGFTLGELMIALTVMGIGLSVAVPGFQTVVKNSRRTTATNQLVTTMHMARSEAVTRNLQVVVCPSTDGAACAAAPWNKGWIVFADANTNQLVDGAETVLASIPELTNLDINTTEFPNFFIYRPSGRIMVNAPAQNTGQLTFCDSRGADHARVVIINSSGQPRASEYDMNGAAPTC
jgi:type IV fimbrial biogenesis protein FimT